MGEMQGDAMCKTRIAFEMAHCGGPTDRLGGAQWACTQIHGCLCAVPVLPGHPEFQPAILMHGTCIWCVWCPGLSDVESCHDDDDGDNGDNGNSEDMVNKRTFKKKSGT